jgi:hypothetical protein
VFEAVARALGSGRNMFGEGGASMNSSEKRRSLGRPGTEGWPASGPPVFHVHMKKSAYVMSCSRASLEG